MTDDSVSIVIPVWNEDPRNLRSLLARLTVTLDRVAPSWEVVFVDDASLDPTRRTLEELAAADERVRVLTLHRRGGQETAVVVGLLAARGDLVCTMDCDLQNRPEEIPRLLACLQRGWDLVLGSRRYRGDWSFRRWLSRLSTLLMNCRWGVALEDWGCGLNGGKRVVFEAMRHDLRQWRGGPLKSTLARQVVRWTHVEVTHDPRRYGRSGYSWAELCHRGLQMLFRGNAVDTVLMTQALHSSRAGDASLAEMRQAPQLA